MTDNNSRTVLSGDALQDLDKALAKAKQSEATHKEITSLIRAGGPLL